MHKATADDRRKTDARAGDAGVGRSHDRGPRLRRFDVVDDRCRRANRRAGRVARGEILDRQRVGADRQIIGHERGLTPGRQLLCAEDLRPVEELDRAGCRAGHLGCQGDRLTVDRRARVAHQRDRRRRARGRRMVVGRMGDCRKQRRRREHPPVFERFDSQRRGRLAPPAADFGMPLDLSGFRRLLPELCEEHLCHLPCRAPRDEARRNVAVLKQKRSSRSQRGLLQSGHYHDSGEYVKQNPGRGVARNPGKSVILSAAKNLRDSGQILRCARMTKLPRRIVAPRAAPSRPPPAVERSRRCCRPLEVRVFKRAIPHRMPKLSQEATTNRPER